MEVSELLEDRLDFEHLDVVVEPPATGLFLRRCGVIRRSVLLNLIAVAA